MSLAGVLHSLSNRQRVYQSDHIDIFHDVEGAILYVDWKGPQTLDMVQRGCEAILEHMIATGTTKVLNDNTNVVGTWADASHWVAVDWFPRMERAGLCCFAWVQSSSRPSRDAANATAMDANRDRLIRLFNDVESAEIWLRELA